jgi:hypothetical protein
MLQDCVDSISHYMEQVDHLEPNYPLQPDSTYATDSESQGSLEMNLNFERVEMIYVSTTPLFLSLPILTLLAPSTRGSTTAPQRDETGPSNPDTELFRSFIIVRFGLVLVLASAETHGECNGKLGTVLIVNSC